MGWGWFVVMCADDRIHANKFPFLRVVHKLQCLLDPHHHALIRKRIGELESHLDVHAVTADRRSDSDIDFEERGRHAVHLKPSREARVRENVRRERGDALELRCLCLS